PLRERLSLQSRHGAADRGVRTHSRRHARAFMARDAADRAATHRRTSPPGAAMTPPDSLVFDETTGTDRSSTGHARLGLFPAALEPTDGDPERLRATLGRIAEAGVDHLCVGDHVSFFVGAGSDGLITATSLLAVQAELPVYVALYLLPLRHPLPVARQLATI